MLHGLFRNVLEETFISRSVSILIINKKKGSFWAQFGVVVSRLFLSVLLFNFSFRAPFFNPLFQGFNSFSSNSISWHFPFSSSSSSVDGSSTANITATKLHNPVDLMQSGKPHEANASEIGSNGNFMNYSEKGMDLQNTHLSNSSEKVKNKSYTVEENVIGEKSIEGKFDERNGNESSAGEYVGSRPDLTSGVGKSEITSADKISNFTNEGKNVGTLGKEEQGSEMTNLVVSSEKINATITHNDSQILEVHKASLKECNIFDGRWVRDATRPYYPAGSCPRIDRDFDCYLNRRPDDGFCKVEMATKWL